MRTFPVSQCLIGIFALAVFIGGLHAYGGIGDYGAGFMPTVLGALLFIFTLIDAAIDRRKSTGYQRRLSREEIRAILGMIVLVTSFVAFVDILGFIVSATCSVFVPTLLRRPKKVFSSLMFAAIAALVIDYIFADLLLVALPQGIWE